MSEIVLGSGGLSWPSVERVCDRYGRVGLQAVQPISAADAQGQGGAPGRLYPCGDWLPFTLAAVVNAGMSGRLVAEVVEARESTHVGDLFRGFSPSTPAVGERVVLGAGALFFEGGCVGLRPADGRDRDWLDPQALYRAHAQTVRLIFETAGA